MTGAELREWRESRGLTQTQLAEYLGMGWETYRKQETGRVAVNALMKLALCEVSRRYKLKRGSVATEQSVATDALQLRSQARSASGRG